LKTTFCFLDFTKKLFKLKDAILSKMKEQESWTKQLKACDERWITLPETTLSPEIIFFLNYRERLSITNLLIEY